MGATARDLARGAICVRLWQLLSQEKRVKWMDVLRSDHLSCDLCGEKRVGRMQIVID